MQQQDLEMQEQEGTGPNWTLIIVGYFAVLAVVIVLLRPLHMSMGGIFFSMVIAGLTLALTILLVKRATHKIAAMQMTARDAYHLAIGYNPYAQEGEEDEEDGGESVPARVPPETFMEPDPLCLGDTFQPSFHAFLCTMCLIVGIRRSGKSTLLLVLVEELARYEMPFILFATMGE